jgi:hypothetical protein
MDHETHLFRKQFECEFINFRSFKIKISKKCIIDIMVNELKRFFPRVGKE